MKKITLALFSFFFSLAFYAQDITVSSFTLVNANTNEDLLEISEGTEINLLEYPNIEFNIRANTTAEVGSVKLNLSGALLKNMTESVAPYALYGDFPVGDYYGQVFPVGSYTLSGTPYSGASAGGTAGQVFSINFKMVEVPLQRPFITTWKTDNPGVSEDNQITIPTFSGETYDYTVDWGDGSSDSGVTGDITHTYATPGTYQVAITGDFPRIYFQSVSLTDNGKLLSVDQWGDIEWKSMERAFIGCSNLKIQAEDAPNLSNVTSLEVMFANCFSMSGNESFGTWDVSNIESMNAIFALSNFNQDIGDWDVSNVVDVSSMFRETPFNQNIGTWDVSNVQDMSYMFIEATEFNQDIGEWDVSNVTNMEGMFSETVAFDQSIGSWDVSSVTDMSSMFEAASFNPDISDWDVSSVLDMSLMFSRHRTFNQDLSRWDVGNVEQMSFMFQGANTFDQVLSNWNVSNVLDMRGMFSNAELSKDNYDTTLIGWSTQQLQNGVTFDGGNSQFCLGEEARQNLIDDFGWVITDGGKAEDCEIAMQRPFITTWKTDNPGTSEDNQITIPTFLGETYNYTVDWGDGIIESNIVSDEDLTHTYSSPGVYTVKISGEFSAIQFSIPGDDNLKLISIDQWGDIKWSSMRGAFFKCENLDVKATDIPDFSNATNVASMFDGCRSLVGNESFKVWDMSSITNMQALFGGAEKFNQPIGHWNVSNVQTMDNLFNGASGFNQDISTWDVSKVTNMFLMFSGAASFNQDLGNWDLSSVNQTAEYNGLADMFEGSALSVENYDGTLMGWVSLEANEVRVPQHLTFDGGNSQFCLGEEARQKLIDDFGWVITDGGKAEDCETTAQQPFITTWKTDNEGTSEDNQITIPTFSGEVYDYTVEWGDGASDSAVTGDITHTYATPGTYQVAITGDFPRIYFQSVSITDNGKLLSVDQWGDIEWTSMESAFENCENMDVTAIDVPDLSRVENLSRMFTGSGIKGNESFNGWNTSNIKDLSGMFILTNFNQDISSWDVSQVTNMASLFGLNTQFNQDISGWDVSNVEDMAGMFYGGWNFDQPLASWDVSKVTNMNQMFGLTKSFNQDITNWDVSSLQTAAGMFEDGTVFDQNIGVWNIQNVTDLNGMFYESELPAETYDSILLGWSTQQLQNGVTFDGGNSQYCQGEEARQKLIDDFGWVITDGGKAEDCIKCPAAKIILNTQQQVDDFAITYDVADCNFEEGILIMGANIVNLDGLSSLTYIEGTLDIANTSVTNLDGLSSLIDVRSSISIEGNPMLIDIGGLSSITDFVRLSITDNVLLINVDGLASMTTIGTLELSNNAALSNVDGFNSLIHVAGDLIIENNISLTNLDGLESLKAIADDLQIENNANLTNIDGLSSVVFIDNNLVIKSNPRLGNVDGLSSLEWVGLSLNIDSNLELTNLGGLSSMVHVGIDLSINDNNSLTSIIGLSGLDSIGQNLIFTNNDALSDCAIDAVCDSDTIVAGILIISGNTGNCLDYNTAKANCNVENSIIDFTLVDSEFDQDILVLENDKVYDIDEVSTGFLLNIRANTNPEVVGSVGFELSGPLTRQSTENVAPYALYGDSSGNYAGVSFAPGTYTVAATPYTESLKGGEMGETKSLSFTFAFAPMAVASTANLQVVEDTEIVFVGSNSTDENGDNDLSYLWDFGDGETSSEADPTHIFENIGEYTVTLTVTNGFGLTSETNLTVVAIVRELSPPVASSSYFSTTPFDTAPLTLTFTSTSYDDIGIVSHEWDFGDGSQASGVEVEHTYTTSGEYMLSLTVTDTDGLTGNQSFPIIVTEPGGNPPIAFIKLSAHYGLAPHAVTFDSSNSISENGIASYLWDFGDGNTSTEANPSHTYTDPGTYVVTLLLTDTVGLTNNNGGWEIKVRDPADDIYFIEMVLIGTNESFDLPEDLSGLPLSHNDGGITIRANVNETTVESVKFELSGPLNRTHIENVSEYMLFGNVGDDYFTQYMPEGEYTLTVTTYGENGAQGIPRASKTVRFTIVDYSNQFSNKSAVGTKSSKAPDKMISLYPNMATDHVTMEVVTATSLEIEQILIHDMMGRKVAQFSPERVSTADGYRLPLEELPAGMYSITVMDTKGGVARELLGIQK